MQIWLSTLLAATPSPTPSIDPSTTFYSPGTIGFIATFLVAAGAIVIIFDMVRRVRRVRYRSDVAAKLEAEALGGGTTLLTNPDEDSQPPKAASPKASAPTPKRTAKPERPAPPARPKRD